MAYCLTCIVITRILLPDTGIKEGSYGKRPVIASVSLGQIRTFDFRKKDYHQSKYSLPLPNGSLLIMKGDLQENWENWIAKSTIPVK